MRYELAKKEDNLFDTHDRYKFSMVKEPVKIDNEFMEKNDIPLPDEYIEVLEKDLDWQDIKWGNSHIRIKDKEYTGK